MVGYPPGRRKFPKTKQNIILNNKYTTETPIFSDLLYSRAITDPVKLLPCAKIKMTSCARHRLRFSFIKLGRSN